MTILWQNNVNVLADADPPNPYDPNAYEGLRWVNITNSRQFFGGTSDWMTLTTAEPGSGNTEYINAWFNNLSHNAVSVTSWTSIFAVETATTDGDGLTIDGNNRIYLTAGKRYKLEYNAIVGENASANQYISTRIRLNDTTNIMHGTTRVFDSAGYGSIPLGKVYTASAGDWLQFEIDGGSGGGNPQIMISYNITLHSIA
jgi:hypothetical protein